MHRPGGPVFEFLDSILVGRNEILITQVHFALDFITATQDEADTVGAFFAKHYVKLWPGKQNLGNFGRTIYSSQKEEHAANNIAQYADRVSKLTGSFCHHLEWRCQKADAVRRAKILSPIDLDDFDHQFCGEDTEDDAVIANTNPVRVLCA